MSYLRLFIELRREDTGEGCGQARVELQDRPGRVDCKVRCGMMGLPVGQTYDMALVCEQGGRYKEYPLGQFMTNPRGQAGPMFRGSFADEPGELPVTGFKAIVVRSPEGARIGGKRIVGYRFEPILIPDSYEEPVMVSEPEDEVASEPSVPPEEVLPEVLASEEVEAAEPEIVEPDVSETVGVPNITESIEAEAFEKLVDESLVEESPEDEAELVEPEPELVPQSAERRKPRGVAPTAVYVLHELRQVEAVCGNAGRRAFQRYRHLILMQENDDNYLGMPCRYRPGQQKELVSEGYTEFYTPHGDTPTYGEFGYWVKRL